MRQNPLIKAIVGSQFLPIHTGTPPKPAILQVTTDIGDGDVQLVISLTVGAARQLQAELSKMLQSLDSQ